jgi:hypothetical protein
MPVRPTAALCLSVLTLVAWLFAWPTRADGQAPACNRACLERALDGYLDALIDRQPARLRLSPSAKFTENGQRLELGDGLWRTITGRGRYALTIADVDAGQAVLMGTVREADVPTILVVRVKVASERIAEIETLVIRNQMAAESLDTIGAPRPVWTRPVPAAERTSRAELVGVGNMYFSGIERNDGRGDYPIADSCARLENGVVTAGDPAAIVGAGQPVPSGRPRLGCRAQFETGMFFYVTRIRDRRFVVVDPERGLAFAFAFFDNGAGEARRGTLRDGTKVVSGPAIPWTWQIAEVFRIEKGLIVAVESVLHPVPYGMGSGWSTWEETMSSRPRW